VQEFEGFKKFEGFKDLREFVLRANELCMVLLV